MTEPAHPDTPAGSDRRTLLLIVGIWLAWAFSLLVFQEIVVARLEPNRPDRVLVWTADETGVRRFGGRPYLAEPTLGTHIAFDSEYYLSIAVVGYDDPEVPAYVDPTGEEVPLNYAFLPAYPTAMGAVGRPLTYFGIEPVAAAAIAGVAVSLLAALAAMLAIHRLVAHRLGDAAGVRAAFYLLIFPTGFYLAQVYSEALFVAASFATLALLAERKPLWAAPLAVVAVLTRPVGVALLIAVAVGLAGAVTRWRRGADVPTRVEWAGWAVAVIGPLAAYLAWSASSLGRTFEIVQREYFGRAFLNLEAAWNGWTNALSSFGDALPETRVYYGLEVAAVVVAVVACAFALRRWPGAALFGLASIAIALGSGEPQGMVRYVLAVPPVFIGLARLGSRPAFDRGWTVLSLLLMALLAAIYSLDFWVA